MKNVVPLKRFGQNYLQDLNIINKIISEINPQEDDNIIEIGPGKGALTESLIIKNPLLTAIEIDKRVIDNLKLKFPTLNLIEADFLEINLSELFKEKSKKLRIVGNIPYNITSPILFKLFENNILIKDAVLMVQYEVAKRMISMPGNKEYGILSVLLNYFGAAKLAFKVSRNVFYPKPNVDSAVVHISFDKQRDDKTFNLKFITMVKAAFGNRRKTLKNSLSNSIFAETDFSGCEINLSLRAEQLSVNDFIRLTEFTCR